LNYSQDHENDLRTLGLDQFISEFELSQVQLDDLIHHATTNGVTFDRNDYENTKDQLKILVKAYIGRRIWNNEGFYPIFNEQNEIYVRAKKLFNQAAQLNASVNSHQN
jgi:carboxyl-terminal processing protease